MLTKPVIVLLQQPERSQLHLEAVRKTCSRLLKALLERYPSQSMRKLATTKIC
jgi:hypothetical protein